MLDSVSTKLSRLMVLGGKSVSARFANACNKFQTYICFSNIRNNNKREKTGTSSLSFYAVYKDQNL